MFNISLITATFNNEVTIEKCLESLKAQTYPHIEHIVVDGSSDDRTVEQIRSLSPDSKVISEPDDGLYHALNKGIARASGDIIGLLHADDTLASPATIKRIADTFGDPAVEVMNDDTTTEKSHGKAEVKGIYGDLEYVRSNGTVLRRWKAGPYKKKYLNRGWMPPHPTLFLRREVYEKFGDFDTRYTIAADYDFMLRVLGPGNTRIRYIPETLIRMTTGGMSNRSVRNIIRKSTDDYLALRRNRIGWPPATLFLKNARKITQFI